MDDLDNLLNQKKALKNPIRKKIIEYLRTKKEANFREIWLALEKPCAYKNLIAHIRKLNDANLIVLDKQVSTIGQEIKVKLNEQSSRLSLLDHVKSEFTSDKTIIKKMLEKLKVNDEYSLEDVEQIIKINKRVIMEALFFLNFFSLTDKKEIVIKKVYSETKKKYEIIFQLPFSLN